MIINSSQPDINYVMDQPGSVLEQVTIEGEIDNLLSRVTITQEYVNHSEDNIEALYTFPLPMRAILTGLVVTIGERKLQGVVSERHEVRNQYEDGITDGDRVIMLEQLTSGMYSMNVGNLQAGEKVLISIAYAELLRWHDDCLRFYLPTTIAPRYGDPGAAGLEDYQVPEASLLAENKFSLRLKLSGRLKNAVVASPSHQIFTQKDADSVTISLSRQHSFMDRDFICLIKQAEMPEPMALIGNDYVGYVAMTAFFMKTSASVVRQPRNLSLVIDCSGSMSGDSINLARRGLIEVLVLLEPKDKFNLIAFGSSTRALHKKLKPANLENIALAKRFARSLEADMGGTEIGLAVNTALADAKTQDIILLTDGEIWDGDELVEKAEKSGCRFFTIGIGSSVNERFVRMLAEKTGGTCEMVSPNEEIKEAILTQAKRIFSPPCQNLVIDWPGSPVCTGHSGRSQHFSGDTLFFFAEYREKPTGAVTLAADFSSGEKLQMRVALDDASLDAESTPSTLARIYKGENLAMKDDGSALGVALKYQLITEKTNYLIVDERCAGGKAETLPVLRKVDNMLAAGWGGTSSVISESTTDSYDIPSFCRAARQSEDDEVILFSRRQPPEQAHKLRQLTTPAEFIQKCNQLHPKRFRQDLEVKNFNDLLDCDLPDRILDAIEKISNKSDSHFTEDLIVLSFLLGLSRSSVSHIFSQKTLKAIKKAQKNLSETNLPAELFSDILTGISDDDWGPGFAE